ncbi:histidine phosphatase family protein [Phormidium sp. CLA17]|uniref:histidine phosphatase family protein n=1 Tax=Leptolyngbya sp. Cla-17 TaxID=2803751 RepID=UPI0018D9AB98|nr:histidine phosphatase family protein [Leptolyngbya sp. Cla-17]MBM0742045.1 histidine phosphatase family protein [Leptolyngbya sp. Cla-17]
MNRVRAIALAGGGLMALTTQLAMNTGSIAQLSNAQSSTSEAAWKLLQQAKPGYVVLMRHAEAPGTGDPANFQLKDCSTQRNLSASGRAQAAKIGQAFRDRAIPIAKIFSSQWCRCLDTARLLNLGAVEPFPALNSFFQNSNREPRQTATIRQWIKNKSSQKGVSILVTHQVNITALTNIFPRQGELIVLNTTADGTIKVVGRI